MAAGQSPDDFAAGTRMNVIAEEATCLVAYHGAAERRQSGQVLELVSPGRKANGAIKASLR